MPPELGQALRRARTCSALTQRRFRQDVRDTRAGLAVRDEIAFAQEQVVQRDRGIARDTVVGRECARRGETGAGLESPVEYRRAHLLVQRAQQEARAAFGQAQREFEFWSHSFCRLWRFDHAIACLTLATYQPADLAMIDLYFSPTPNGLKARLFLEEAQLDYRIVPVSLSRGEQFQPEFLAISPNNKIPAIVDHAPVGGGAPLEMFESGAIMLYLAEKIGRFIPADARAHAEVLQWLFWQMSGLGPMAGQAGYFRVYAPQPVEPAIERYTRELRRLYGVLDRRLDGREFVAGAEYTIADMACYPWIVPHAPHGQDLADFPHLRRWFEMIGRRSAVLRTYAGVEDVYTRKPSLTDAQRQVLFGQTTPAAACAI